MICTDMYRDKSRVVLDLPRFTAIISKGPWQVDAWCRNNSSLLCMSFEIYEGAGDFMYMFRMNCFAWASQFLSLDLI